MPSHRPIAAVRGRLTHRQRKGIEAVKSSGLDPETERLLIERTRGGSSEALADLVRIHSPRIYQISLKILKNHADAQDNVQNVLCKMFMSIGQFEGRSRLATWLFRVTMNEALMKIGRCPAERILRDALTVESEDCPALDIKDYHADPERQYLAKELLAKALLGLKPSMAQLFIRHKVEGWTQRELSRQIGTSVSTVKSRIFKARERMQKHLQAVR